MSNDYLFQDEISKLMIVPDSSYIDLILYYSLDNTTKDLSCFENHGILDGGTYGFDGRGFANSALYINEAVQGVRMTNRNLTTGKEGTICLWLKKVNYGRNQTDMIFLNWPNDDKYRMYLNYHEQIGLHFRYGWINVQDNTYLSWTGCYDWQPNKWHFIAISWKNVGNKMNLKLYVDGNLFSEKNTSLIIDVPANFSFGKPFPDNTYGTFYGTLDEIRWYKRALTNNQII